ncbi:vWA domain-containing protein [Hymenobacter arizonensis]|uniref:VWFA domain-containing protein n=1 Tax=Hymenobacter arizonensis TaxID=1227077 RepID=A0A1I5Z7P0_HYMAR|nr:vWA domain-containing protein [Hymenobacter arizonensis]SFQ52464.1 hypothetical protein SAMN04515668_2788 [Hymenobacter arizonensis]
MAYKCANCAKSYAQPTADYFCTDCGYDGLLIDDAVDTKLEENGGDREIGLCILLMDASGSMDQPAFPGSPLTKLRLVANSAAQGIFDLQQMGKADDAYICAMLFDNTIKQIFFKSVKELLEEHNFEVKVFANYLYEELAQMGGTTDINGALQAANSFAKSFTTRSIPNMQGYTPLEHVVLTKAGQSRVVPNVRVLLYTDGVQYIDGKSDPLVSPFKEWETDILMGAFFGDSSESGCNELRSILSKCPNHDFEQFFLLDQPSKVAHLRKLFRMASGASGFCPLCIPKE